MKEKRRKEEKERKENERKRIHYLYTRVMSENPTVETLYWEKIA